MTGGAVDEKEVPPEGGEDEAPEQRDDLPAITMSGGLRLPPMGAGN